MNPVAGVCRPRSTKVRIRSLVRSRLALVSSRSCHSEQRRIADINGGLRVRLGGDERFAVGSDTEREYSFKSLLILKGRRPDKVETRFDHAGRRFFPCHEEQSGRVGHPCDGPDKVGRGSSFTTCRRG